MIAFAVTTRALGSIDQLMRTISDGFGGAARSDVPIAINRRFTAVPPNAEFSFGYGYRHVYF